MFIYVYVYTRARMKKREQGSEQGLEQPDYNLKGEQK
jgi:hypothetical protein